MGILAWKKHLLGGARFKASTPSEEIPNEEAVSKFRNRLDPQLANDFFPGRDSLLYAAHHVSRDDVGVTLIVLAEEGSEKSFTDLALSIVAMACLNWDLAVIGPNDKAFDAIASVMLGNGIDMGKMHPIRCEGSAAAMAAAINAFLEIAPGQYVALLRPGDMVSPMFAFNIANIAKYGAFPFYTYAVIMPTDDVWTIQCAGAFQYDRFCEYDEQRHHVVFEREAMLRHGGFAADFGTASVFELCLRLCDDAGVGKISEVMVFDSFGYSRECEFRDYKKAHEVHCGNIGRRIRVEEGVNPQICSITYPPDEKALVSIIVPSKDNLPMLTTLLDSIAATTSYQNYEIVVVENGSTAENREKYDALPDAYGKLKVAHYQGPFNYSRLINFGRAFASGDYLLLLNNDMKIINEDWLSNMLGYAQQDEVGVVGAVLLYPDDTIQHIGVIADEEGNVLHFMRGLPFDDAALRQLPFNCASVTGACQLVSASRFDQVGGYDEEYRIAYSDVDFCYKMLAQGCRTVCLSAARLYHFEGKTRASDSSSEERARFEQEKAHFMDKFSDRIRQYEPFLG